MMADGLPIGADAMDVVERLGLQPHPEGGWYRETWRGVADAEGGRGTGTAILFLLETGQRSRWHRVDATEIWFYHAGASLRLLTAPSDGKAAVREHRIGADVMAGDRVQHIIAPGEWQAAEAENGWCLVSCVVVPAFEFSGFELGEPGWEPGRTGVGVSSPLQPG